jgi:hypothetical protein
MIRDDNPLAACVRAVISFVINPITLLKVKVVTLAAHGLLRSPKAETKPRGAADLHLN